MVLTEQERANLKRLADSQARGDGVRWDEPKTIEGYGARPIETIEVADYNDPTRKVEKQVATIRTDDGLVAIWSGLPALDEKLFDSGDITGRPIIVTYHGERLSQSSGRNYKSFDVVVGDAPEAAPELAPEEEFGF
jgi:hypothetical protein